MLKTLLKFFPVLLLVSAISVFAQNETIEEAMEHKDGCTTVTVGKDASFDGSVMTSHTMDGHKDRTDVTIIPAKTYPSDSKRVVHKKVPDENSVMPRYKFVPAGEIPQVEKTYGYINSIIRCINDQQFAMGESTFGGRETLRSDNGLIQYEEFSEIIMERAATAREAIKIAAEVTETYGWIDGGECYTFADPEEVWHFEIVGPGQGKKGSIWAAQRIPDGHIGVNANASRIMEIDLDNPDYFMASDNVFQVAIDSGWWNPDKEPFRFCYAYDPDGRRSLSSRRREWRAFQLAAPSLNLDPNAETYPFSIKPDEKITLDKMIEIFRDYYEGTPFNPVKYITWQNPKGEFEISPHANPFMPYDQMPLFKINGGWNKLGERTIARWYTTYATIIQLRNWLPPEVGGVVWFAWDNVATSVYTPLYSGITDVPDTYKVCGRETGFSRDAAWWAFNRLSTLTSQRWGDMRHDVMSVWDEYQQNLFANQSDIEKEVVEMLDNDRSAALKKLTDYSNKHASEIIDKAWDLGDFLWNKYDEKW